MPSLGNIVVNDAEVTPVAHTFAPVTTDGALAELANRSAVTPQGFETLRAELKKPNGNRTAYALNLDLYDPVEGTVEGQSAVVRFSSCSLKFNFSPLSSVQERKNLIKIAQNLLGHATVTSMAENLEPIY